MEERFSRTAMVIGGAAVEKLRSSRIAVFGVGGVGGFAAEALIRAGIGALDLFDNDVVSVSNLNRQIIALHSTVGQPKAQVMKARLLDISPDAKIEARQMFYLPENADSVDLSVYDYILDAVDTVAAKLELAVRAQALGVRMISAMGAGNKLDPTRFEVADIYQTSVCPLARVMRTELRKRGVTRLKVVYSKETPVTQQGGRLPGSLAWCPSTAGLIMASEVVKDLISERQYE